MKKLMIGAVCAMMAAVTFAEPSVEITEAYQQTPGSGIVDCTYTVSGLETGLQYDLCIKVGAKGCATKKTVTIEKVSAGTATKSVDVKTLLGQAYPNVTLFAELKVLPGIQLWANGPYFATCNVGATKPEEAGYYFWWGDTVGYTNNGATASVQRKWVSVADGTTSIKFYSSDDKAGQTYGKSIADLYNKGYIDANSTSGKLKPAYDAATAHLGAPWRMPTSDEIQGLVKNCTATWTTQNGVEGLLVKGKTDGYTDKSIFLPAAGYGNGASHINSGESCLYWSSTPIAGDSDYYAWYLFFYYKSGDDFKLDNGNRYYGRSVRAVR